MTDKKTANTDIQGPKPKYAAARPRPVQARPVAPKVPAQAPAEHKHEEHSNTHEGHDHHGHAGHDHSAHDHTHDHAAHTHEDKTVKAVPAPQAKGKGQEAKAGGLKAQEGKATAKSEAKVEAKNTAKASPVSAAKKEPKKKGPKKSRKVIAKKSKQVLALRRRVQRKRGLPTFRGRFGKRSIRKKANPKWDRWRFPRGLDVNHELSEGFNPRAGYGGPRETRHVHPSGHREVLIRTQADLARVGKADAIRVIAGMGRRKKVAIVDKAIAQGIKVLNP